MKAIESPTENQIGSAFFYRVKLTARHTATRSSRGAIGIGQRTLISMKSGGIKTERRFRQISCDSFEGEFNPILA